MEWWGDSPQGHALMTADLARCAGPVVIGQTHPHIDVYLGRDLSICNGCAAMHYGSVTHRPFPLSGRCQTCGAADHMTDGPDGDGRFVIWREVTEGDLARCAAPVRLGATHPQVDWWGLQDGLGACNHCKAVVSAAAFHRGPYDGNRCPRCATPEVGPGLSAATDVPGAVPPVLTASFSRFGGSRGGGYLLGAAAAVLALWIANAGGGVATVLAVEVVVAVCGCIAALLTRNAIPGGAGIAGRRRRAKARVLIVWELVALGCCWVVWIVRDWPSFSLLATVAVGAAVGNAALLNRRPSAVPAWHEALVQKASDAEAVRLPIDVDGAIRHQLQTLGVPEAKVESVARGLVLVAFRQPFIGRQIDLRGRVAPQSQLAQLVNRVPFITVDELDGHPQAEVRRLIRLTGDDQQHFFVCSVQVEELDQQVRFAIGRLPA